MGKSRKSAKQARLTIVAELLKKGYHARTIQDVVNKEYGLSASLNTIKNDIQTLFKEWKEQRIEDIDTLRDLELQRIDLNIRELYEQWYKSKEDYEVVRDKIKRNNGDVVDITVDENGYETIADNSVRTKEKEKVRALGDPAYMREINGQLIERRKMLGLYKEEKKQIDGNITVENLLVNSGLLTDDTNDED
jgi:hypothetical protein